MATFSWNTSMTSIPFWNDWAQASFGPAVSAQIAAIFSAIESFNLPRPVNWINGPGGLQPDVTQCTAYHAQYGFVDQLLALQPDVVGAMEAARYEYWINTFLYMRQLAAVECAWYDYNEAIAYIQSQPASHQQAAAQTVGIPSRITLVNNATLLLSYLLPTISTRGEMGTVRNVLAHSLVLAIEDNTAQLETYLQGPLPPDAMPQLTYIGTPKILVPVARTTLHPGETLTLQAVLLMNGDWAEGANILDLYVSPLGQGAYTAYTMAVITAGRAVCQTSLPPQGQDFEYYITTTSAANVTLYWPAPSATFTVVIQDN